LPQTGSSSIAERKHKLLTVIDASAEVMGKIAATAFRFSFKNVQKKEWESVVDNAGLLESHIRAVFGAGGEVLLQIMSKNICREFNLEYLESRSLTEYVNDVLS